MKKLMFAFCLMFGTAVAVQAQETSTQDQPSSQYKSQDDSKRDMKKGDKYDEKEAISTTELPSSVLEQLGSQDYSGWTVNNAYRKEKDGQTFYAVELSQGGETKMVKFDSEGKKIKEKKKKDKDS
ncbi:hypothetical protein [Chryseosolibacter indicus]|uniref:PepSY domain-containing protein n=1 Tax=Chryseosolibacter indicus TaxID=2782351 RepID=A0ABS5VWU7_9BACT|nr:hypothetical protein [Chryseosolibacter indicus]MBT1704476.1 hypothetical protein [Chryseosolibacter indicus]